jgi:signal peptidase I
VEKYRPGMDAEPRESIIFDWVEALVTALVFIVLLFSLLVRITGVKGNSMEPTLYNRDNLIVSNLFYKPKAGDIVIISKQNYQKEPIVKRVIALENQTVWIDPDTGGVYVDGQKLDEPYIKEVMRELGTVSFPVTVPKGHIFVMGDNRNNSLDSRSSVIGMVDCREVMGKVLLRVFPFDAIGRVR